ncbi:hypothetical protein BP6252_05302 [Coleophoma cylindrospora]|uniref:Methyltransferase type 11 domain-containing protein n=1 Tax=Coleophoma cylindrospora TaxID=1849047 RepID=A0A3D8RT84_9HELO|nr:hypothetical protein BP6252_05302 [Coleophoma cylindrospora]
MASPTPNTDPTFRSYSATQAQTYATYRTSYPERFYSTILDFHHATGGQDGFLVDVGCGPGNATRDLARFFDAALGVDPGAAMIDAARGLAGVTKRGGPVAYEVAAAEEFARVTGGQPVDLVVAAMAAHWFDMERFWIEADKVLKPGGTVALWTCASSFCHPKVPHASEINQILLRLERETLAPYAVPANLVSMNMYDTLHLPWANHPPVSSFPPEAFQRLTYDREGVLSDGEHFFGGDEEVSIDELEQGLGTASMVTRWREANAEKVGTQDDVVTAFAEELRNVLGPGGVLVKGSGTAILLFKKI